MSIQPTDTPIPAAVSTAPPRNTTSQLFRSSGGKASGRILTSANIADDIAAFTQHGGHIEVLGITPYRTHASSAFRSKADVQRKAAEDDAKPAVVKG